MRKKEKSGLKKVWHFIWEENSIWSWIVNVILAFVIIKFLIYPGLGLVLGTSHPIVAVVSGSMEHPGTFNEWWSSKEQIYQKYGISKQEFQTFDLKNGFNKGDLIVLVGKKPEKQQVGDIIVFDTGQREPVIHRIVNKWDENNNFYFTTLGDNNKVSIQQEKRISEEQILGNAFIRIPVLGYVKIIFAQTVSLVRINVLS